MEVSKYLSEFKEIEFLWDKGIYEIKDITQIKDGKIYFNWWKPAYIIIEIVYYFCKYHNVPIKFEDNDGDHYVIYNRHDNYFSCDWKHFCKEELMILVSLFPEFSIKYHDENKIVSIEVI